jgi:CRISPR-associated protein Cas2
MDLHCYLVTYDISSPKRWRRVYQTMLGFGEHVQLSVFRCDLTPERLVLMRQALERAIHYERDQVLIVSLGKSTPRVIEGIDVLGRPRRFRLPSATVV